MSWWWGDLSLLSEKGAGNSTGTPSTDSFAQGRSECGEIVVRQIINAVLDSQHDKGREN